MRALALQIAAQLPDNIDEAVAVLALARALVEFLASLEENQPSDHLRLLRFPTGAAGPSTSSADRAGGK